MSTDELVMYLIVNDSLQMSPGKMAAQVGHAVDLLCEMQSDYGSICTGYQLGYTDCSSETFSYSRLQEELFKQWRQQSRAKIILKANEIEWEKLKIIAEVKVQDEGRTEVAPGSITVLGFWPMIKSNAPKIIQFLKKY